MDGQTLREKFGAAVRNARKSGTNWNQTRLAKEINALLPENCPIKFGQESISKLERGDPKLQLTELVVRRIQDLLNLPKEIVDPLLMEIGSEASPKLAKNAYISIHEAGQLISKSSHIEFSSYFGDYYCMFNSTDSNNQKLIKGKLHIAGDDAGRGQCTAYMTLYDKDNAEIKWYSGPFFINLHYRTWHCILIGQEKQEICMLTSSHFNSTIEKNLLNVALVLTTSSGAQKRPTMHRMIISREPIRKADWSLIQAQLRLNSDSITISETALENLQKETEKDLQKARSKNTRVKLQAILTCIEKIKELGKEDEFYVIDESIIYDSDTIITDKHLRSFVVSKIRSCTKEKYYNKISQTVQDICVDIITKRK